MPQITLELTDKTYQQASNIAKQTGKPIETILESWINRFGDDVPVNLLSDEHLLALADQQMTDAEQSELENLLALQREGQLDEGGKQKLDTLMAAYRHGLIRKAHAMKEAIERGLRSESISDWPDERK